MLPARIEQPATPQGWLAIAILNAQAQETQPQLSFAALVGKILASDEGDHDGQPEQTFFTDAVKEEYPAMPRRTTPSSTANMSRAVRVLVDGGEVDGSSPLSSEIAEQHDAVLRVSVGQIRGEEGPARATSLHTAMERMSIARE